MDVNNAEANREVELARRLLREREAEHARETDSLRKSNREQLDEMRSKQKATLEEIRDKTNRQLEDARSGFDESTRATTDSFQRKLAEDRTEAYDRYGRLATDSNRERNKDRELKAREIGDLIAGNEAREREAEEVHKHTLANSQKAGHTERQELSDAFNQKLEEKNRAMQEAVRREQRLSGERLRETEHQSADKGQRELIAADAKYKKLLEDGMTTQDRMRRQAEAHDEQLKAESFDVQQRQRTAFENTLNDYRDRAGEVLDTTIIKDNNERNRLMRENEAAASRALQDREIEKQRLNTEARSAIASLEKQNELDKTRAELQKNLSDARHRQSQFINESAINEANKLNADEVKARYVDNLKNLEEKNRRSYEQHTAEMENKAFEAESKFNAERQDTSLVTHAEAQHKAVEAQRAKNHVIREYEARQRGIEDSTEMQRAESAKAAKRDVATVRDQATREIASANREKTAAAYQGQLELRNRTDELEALRAYDLNDAEARSTAKAKRMNETYNRNLLANKDAFDEEAATYKYESAMQLLKSRGDSEHEKRIALLDLLQKNRAQMTAMESRFNEQKDSYEAELVRTKADNDKAMRETMRRARETIETERMLHNRELEARDMATKEKLKLQEEAFKDQVEKIKRSYDLSNAKKS